MEEVAIIGVDLAKNVFQLQGAAVDGSALAQPPPGNTAMNFIFH